MKSLELIKSLIWSVSILLFLKFETLDVNPVLICLE